MLILASSCRAECGVDQHVHAPPGVDGLLHHGFHRCKVGHRGRIGQVAARSTNLIHHLLRRTCCTTAAIHGTTQIIDQHLGAAGRQGQRMLTPQAATCTRDDGYAALNSMSAMERLSCI